MIVRALADILSAKGLIPTGSKFKIPDHLLSELAGRVEPIYSDPIAEHDYPLRLEAGQLRGMAVFPGGWPDGGLTPQIIRLTGDNLELQRKLLRLHVGHYCPGVHWQGTLRRWRERAAYLFEKKGLALDDANYQAATELKMLAFADELGLKEPTP